MSDLDAISVIVDAMRAKLSHCCGVESGVLMPERAQRINGHEHYRCCLDQGHAGQHRWPRDGSIAEWDQEGEQ